MEPDDLFDVSVLATDDFILVKLVVAKGDFFLCWTGSENSTVMMLSLCQTVCGNEL